MVASPVYYASANATLVACLDRLFYSTRFDKRMKVGAAIAAARRGGLTSTFDELNKYFAISGMPIASGQYRNGIHGRKPGEAAEDLEGLPMMRALAESMVFLMCSIAIGREVFVPADSICHAVTAWLFDFCNTTSDRSLHITTRFFANTKKVIISTFLRTLYPV